MTISKYSDKFTIKILSMGQFGEDIERTLDLSPQFLGRINALEENVIKLDAGITKNGNTYNGNVNIIKEQFTEVTRVIDLLQDEVVKASTCICELIDSMKDIKLRLEKLENKDDD